MAGFGDTLQQARAHKGVTLKEAEQSTRINRHHLAALENEQFEALPPLIYQRGIVRNYAVYLDLDPVKLLALFEEAHGTIGVPVSRGGVSAVPPIDMPNHWAPNFAIIAFSVVLGAIVFAWVYSAYVAPTDNTSTPTLAVPTMTPFENDIVLPTDAAVTPTTAVTVPAVATAPQPTSAVENQSAADADATSTASARGDNQRSLTSTDSGEVQPTATPGAATELAARNEQRQSDATANGEPVSGFTITAQTEDLTLTVTVNGTVEFEGTLAAGASTEMFIGTQFDVSTSSGAGTLFTNACGDQFYMGFEAGQANYPFAADGSCTP